MKTKILSVLLLVVVLFTLASCNTVDAEGLWENATYRRDKELGNGEKTVEVQVIAGEHSVTFAIHTDADTLGDALLEHELVDGEMGDYGLYVKAVNGITADYSVDGSYWSFTKDGEYMMTGVDGETINGGEHYELTYTK